MQKNVLLLLMMFSSCFSFAQYPVEAIPKNLLDNANAVKRLEETFIEIHSPRKATVKRHYVYTILNEKGDNYAPFYAHYDRFTDIQDISGTLYDAAGNKIKNVKKRDIQDVTANDGSNLALDDRFKVHNFYYRSYPYTVEYTLETRLDGFFYLPRWRPVSTVNLAVEKSTLTVSAPADFSIQYKAININAPSVAESGKNKNYAWQLAGFSAIENEILLPDLEEITPNVLLAPGRFEIDKYAGSMNSWDDFGKFMNKMYDGRDALPDAMKQSVQQLTAGKSTIDKVKTLYNYLQNNSRYISIQLGIGGWQPMDANFVYTKKYGDCKALTNYMNALLKEAGIKGYNVLVNAGSDKNIFYEDFPSNQFNHVIACVPHGKDTLWLECTSQTNPFNYMGGFTGDRKGLLIHERGATVVSLPVYAQQNNLQLRKVEGTIDEHGNLSAKIRTLYTGLQQDDISYIYHNTTNEDQLKRLKRVFSVATYDIKEHGYQQLTGEVPQIQETFTMEAPNYASVSGKRIFIKPLILSANTYRLETEEKRRFDLVYDVAFIDKDTISLHIPQAYKPESLPTDVQLINKFGNYRLSYKINGQTIQITREYSRNKGRFPAKDYREYVDFYNAIVKADNNRLVFVKTD